MVFSRNIEIVVQNNWSYLIPFPVKLIWWRKPLLTQQYWCGWESSVAPPPPAPFHTQIQLCIGLLLSTQSALQQSALLHWSVHTRPASQNILNILCVRPWRFAFFHDHGFTKLLEVNYLYFSGWFQIHFHQLTVPKAPLPRTLPFFHWIVSSVLSVVEALLLLLPRRPLRRLHIVWRTVVKHLKCHHSDKKW